jgi:hypothetical protein
MPYLYQVLISCQKLFAITFKIWQGLVMSKSASWTVDRTGLRMRRIRGRYVAQEILDMISSMSVCFPGRKQSIAEYAKTHWRWLATYRRERNETKKRRKELGL